MARENGMLQVYKFPVGRVSPPGTRRIVLGSAACRPVAGPVDIERHDDILVALEQGNVVPKVADLVACRGIQVDSLTDTSLISSEFVASAMADWSGRR